MARNPVMLTAIAVVHWNEKRLPEQRADLYESIIKWLSKSRMSKEGRPSPDRCITLLQDLALSMQDDPQGRKTQITRHLGARAIEGNFREYPEQAERIRYAEQFLREEEMDSGIVVGRGEHDIRFWHLTFQEYLAARALPAHDYGNRLLKTDKPYRPEWREVVLLLAGVLQQRGIQLVDGMFQAILEQLGAKPSLETRARCIALLGAVLDDLSPVGYQPADERYRRMLNDLYAVFDAKRSQPIPIEECIAAAEAIGKAGDPRFANPSDPNLWITIPAGSFWMGAQKSRPKDRNHDPAAFDDEGPVHQVTIPEYRIGKYPVTVREYLRFVEAGGYEENRFWTDATFGKWSAPEKWDEQLSSPTRPVVGVNWYEAAAYASWSNARLPSEAEWERAARGEGENGRRYPWSDKPDPSPRLLNYSDSRVGHPTPVGVYPLGATPEGVCDLAGNMWEWCQDVWHETYKGAPSEGSAWTGGDEKSRVLRGGSWDLVAWFCRGACPLQALA